MTNLNVDEITREVYNKTNYIVGSASDAAGAEENVEAACPEDNSTVVASCLCEEPTNIYAAPSELNGVFFILLVFNYIPHLWRSSHFTHHRNTTLLENSIILF